MRSSNDRYLRFVRQTADLLWERQRVALAGNPDAEPCLVVSCPPSPAWTSIARREDGHYDLYPIQERVLEAHPTRLDLGAWPWLERLSDLAGDPVWRRRVETMAHAFSIYGFDPRSGLGYLGDQAQFDVVRLGPVSTTFGVPMFKPADGLPLETLWRHAARQMDRMFRSVYLALVTRPSDLSYNRFCYYGHDDNTGRPFLAFDPAHCAFGLTGALLIHGWIFHWLKTRTAQSLAWAQAMTAKWQALQHPATGLIPHWLGSDDPRADRQAPRPYAHARDTGTALVYLSSAHLLRDETEPVAVALRAALQRMGVRLAGGMARYGYDACERLFPNWLRVADGRVDREVIYYAFATQAQKEEAVRRDPRLAVAGVNGGAGLLAAGMPSHLARAAELTGDADLLARSRLIAAHIMEHAATVRGARNEHGQWQYGAIAGGARTLLCLARATGDADYRAHAAALLDPLLDALEQTPGEPEQEWWRFPARNALCSVLLEWCGDEALQ